MPLDLPEALHHELEVRRLDPLLHSLVLDPSAAAEAATNSTGRNLVEHSLGERGLDPDRLATERLPAGKRLLDCCTSRLSGEAIEP